MPAHIACFSFSLDSLCCITVDRKSSNIGATNNSLNVCLIRTGFFSAELLDLQALHTCTVEIVVAHLHNHGLRYDIRVRLLFTVYNSCR